MIICCFQIFHLMTSSIGNIFRVTGPLCGKSPFTGEFPSQRPATRSFDIFFDLHLNKRLSKQAGDLRRHRAHYDVIVMNFHKGGLHPKKYAHGACFLVFCCGLLPVDFSHFFSDVILGAMASQITSLSIVYSTVYSGADHRKHQSSAPLTFVRGPVIGEFAAQMVSNAENASIWWRHHIFQDYFADTGAICPGVSEIILKNISKWVT